MEPFIHASAEIDVEEIMAAIRKKIQDKKDSGLLKQSEIDEIAEMELQPLPDFLEIPSNYENILYPGFAENMAAANAPSFFRIVMRVFGRNSRDLALYPSVLYFDPAGCLLWKFDTLRSHWPR